MKLNQYSAKTGEFVKTLLEEQNERYIEPLTPIVFLKNDPSRFIYRTNNRDGYFSLYLCEAATGKVLKRLTDVNADVEMVGQDDKFVYYTSAEVSPVPPFRHQHSHRSAYSTLFRLQPHTDKD